MQINLLPLYSRLADSKAASGVSLHQQATWEALSDPEVDAVINTSVTGDGKSYAAFGAYPDGGVLAMYPTNELVRDQERQLATYYKNPNFRIQRLTGYDLEAWSRIAKQSKAETLLDLSDTDILLTNPDLFYYLHQGNYIKEFIKSGMGDKLGLWQQIDQRFKALIFDEFHIYQPSQVSGVINTLLLMRSLGIKHKYIFLSATPNRHLVKFLELAGLKYRVISGEYNTCGGTGWRQINQPVTLNLEPTTRGEQWIYDNEKSIVQFFTQYPGSKGAVILNSIASVKRVRRRLAALLKPLIHQEYGNLKNLGLNKIALPVFVAAYPVERIKQDLRLNVHFPVYSLKDMYSTYDRNAPYCIAFDQAALMLDAYLGQGEVIDRDMIAHHSRQVFQSEIDEDEAFLEGYFSDKLSDVEWAESVEIVFTKEVPTDIFEFPTADALNQIRHKYTNYEEVLHRWFTSDAAREIVKKRFNDAIALKFQEQLSG